MQIVIDIAQNEYDALEKLDAKYLLHIIQDGTPLPKGHGRLIDADALETSYGLECATKYGNKSKEQQAHSYDTMMMYEIADMLDYAPTVIEADKEDLQNE